MAVAEIPGFYYDVAKNKYFKIERNHAATSTGVYTQDRVKKAKIEAQTQKEKRRKDELAKKEAGRRKWTSNTCRSGTREHLLRMNIGYHTHLGSTMDDQNQIWANKVTGNRDFRVSWDRNISTFEILPKLGGCMTVGEKQFLSWYPDPYDHFYSCSRSSTKMPVLSLCMTSSAVDPLDERVLVASGNTYCIANAVKSENPIIVQEQTVKAATMIRCSTASPSGIFALGGSSQSARHGLVVLTKPDGTIRTYIKPKSDVFALEYMNDNILLSGSRDGKVRVYDLRSDRSEQSSDQSVLQHTSTITHLRALRNGHHLLVNGLQNSAALYDLRFQQEDAVMTYPTTNLSSTTLGFDLSRSEDVFAVAGEDATARLYSTYTGKLLRTLELLEDSHNIRFAEDLIDGSPELYIASGPYLQRWRIEHFH